MGMFMKRRLGKLAIMLCAILCVSSNAAYAVTGNETCTDFATLYSNASAGTPGILSNITTFIKGVITTASSDLFNAFTGSTNYTTAVYAAITLMITVYGVGFLIGIVQANFAQVLTRLIKIGIILTLISPGGWNYFNDNVGHFFNDGTDQIIGKVISIGTGTTYDPTAGPFVTLDGIAKVMLSPDMVIAVMGSTFNGGPYGLLMGGLLGAAMAGLIKLFIQALKIYATSFVVRALLLGVAPIFIVFLLFERTKQLFSGWVNVMVFLTLQPILFFTFVSFFIVMLQTASQTMMGGNELCWSEFKSVGGSQNKMSFWRFKKPGGSIDTDEQTWQGPVSCYLNGGNDENGKPCPNFPINIVDILSFLILIYVAGKFGSVVEQIATEISNSFVNLDQGSKLALNQGKAAEGAGGSPANAPAGGQPVRPNSTQQTTRQPGAGR